MKMLKTSCHDIETLKLFAYDYATRRQHSDLKDPKTLTDKIRWLKVFDANPLKTYCADKILVHEHVRSKIGKDMCLPIKEIIGDMADLIEKRHLEDRDCVLKCNHGSGFNFIVRDECPSEVTDSDVDRCRRRFRTWLDTNYAMNFGELQYFGIRRQVYAEEFIDIDREYKIMCFNGEPVNCRLVKRLGKQAYHNYYDMDFRPLLIEDGHQPMCRTVADVMPRQYSEMKDIAKTLAADFKLVRVDFLISRDDILYISEMTFTPSDGAMKFKDRSWDYRLGEMLKI